MVEDYEWCDNVRQEDRGHGIVAGKPDETLKPRTVDLCLTTRNMNADSV